MSKLNSIVFNELSVKYDELYSKEQANLIMNEHPKIIIPKNNYSIIMVDPDAPGGTWLHWLIINGNKTVIKYAKPTPPSGIHRYYIFVYEQNDTIDVQPIEKRNDFKLKDFVDKYNLLLKYKFKFRVGG